MRIELPWPSRWLSQNASNGSRKARMASYGAKKKARSDVRLICMSEGLKEAMPDAHLHFTFYPPDRRRRDIQNMPGMLKAYIDGIADAMKCDDNGFRVHWPVEFEEPVKGGCVVVEIVVP